MFPIGVENFEISAPGSQNQYSTSELHPVINFPIDKFNDFLGLWVVEELNLSLPVKSRVHKTDLPTTHKRFKFSRFFGVSFPHRFI